MARKSQAEKDAEKVKLMTQRFRKAEDAVSEKHRLWSELDMFDRGEQWKNASIPPWVAKPMTNYIRYIRTLKRANLASTVSKATFIPTNPQFQEQVSKLQQAYDHVWENENVSRTIRRVIDRMVLQGTALVYVYNEDSYVGGIYKDEYNPQNQLYSGKICVKQIPIFNFFPDPDAYELQKCKFIEITEIVTLAEVKNNPEFVKYCEEQGTIKKLKDLQLNNLGTTESESGAILDRETNPLNNGMNIIGDEMVTLHCHWERKYTEEGTWRLDCYYYLKDVNFILLKRENVQPNSYPFAMCLDEQEENTIWGTSTIMDILENQKIINRTSQTAAIIGTLHQNPQKVVARESGINASDLARTGTLPGKVWTTNADPSNSIVNIKPPDIPKGLFELEDRMKNDIREIVGVNEAYTGNSVGSLTTSTGVNSLIERATIRDKDKMVQIDAFVEDLSHLIALTILYNWKDIRPLSITAENGEAMFAEFEPFDEWTAENLEWRVKSNVYAKAPTTQASRRQQADQLMQMQGQFQYNPPIITPEEWIQFQDFDMKEDILRRMEEDRQAMLQKQQQDVVGQITKAAKYAHELMMNGAPPEQLEQLIYQFASQLVQQQQPQSGTRPPDAPQEPQAPQGMTGQMAMANMAQGM